MRRSEPREWVGATAEFVPAPGLGSPHLQTIYASYFRSKVRPTLRAEAWELDDGDFVDVELLDAPADRPHLLILHGLEGSSRAGYVGAILRGAAERGWGAVAMSFRSCGSSGPNRLVRFYHSGETTDALQVLARMRERVRGPVAGVGFSLGGNVILRILGEGGDRAPLDAAAVVSVPLDLQESVRRLDGRGPMARLYRGVFLRSLRKKALEKAARFPEALDAAAIRGASTIQAFDDVVTARLHGFEDAADYYRRCSSGPILSAIRRPTLYLASRDDPFFHLPAQLPEAPYVEPLLTERGGHVGFVAGSLRRPVFWAEGRAIAFLEGRLR